MRYMKLMYHSKVRVTKRRQDQSGTSVFSSTFDPGNISGIKGFVVMVYGYVVWGHIHLTYETP